MIKKVIMPAAGQTTDVATVTKLKVAVGDSVQKGDILLEVETDKAIMPIECFARGFVTEIYVKEFDKIDAGYPLLAIGDAADLEAAKNAAAAPSEPTVTETADEPEDDFAPVVKAEPVVNAAAPVREKSSPAPAVGSPLSGVKAMPNAKKVAAELGVALDSVVPSNGLFIKTEDVKAAANIVRPISDGETLPVARIRNTLARRWDESAKLPTFSIGITVNSAAYAAVSALSADITPAHFVMLALAKLSARYPLLRVRFENGEQKLSDTAETGYAVFAENGTVSATVSDTASLGLTAIADACRANAAAISSGDLSSVGGSSVTVSDLSAYNIDSFTPQLCQPEVAALGVAGGADRFTVTGVFDIRVFEGSVGAALMSDLKARLENPALMLL